jgi:hypothetical protein
MKTMTTKDVALLEKRAEVKLFITDGSTKAFPAYLFDLTGKVLKRTFHLTRNPHWIIEAFFLLIIIYVPGMLVAIILREMPRWNDYLWSYMGMIWFGYLAAVVCYVNVAFNLLPGIYNHIVDSILVVEDLEKLKEWLAGFWSVRNWLSVTIIAGIITAIAFTVGISYRIGDFIGFGLATMTFSVAPFFVGAIYILIYMLGLPPQLATYQIKIYDLDPAQSEVIQRMSSTLSTYLYLVAGYVTIGTTYSSLNPVISWWVWGSILLGWIPTISQFLVNQYYIHKIIINAKWVVLNQLQQQIIDLRNKDISDSPEAAVKQINALMDLHDRIRAKPNSMLNLGTGISFFNQLMLPMLGLISGNMDKLLNLLKP